MHMVPTTGREGVFGSRDSYGQQQISRCRVRHREQTYLEIGVEMAKGNGILIEWPQHLHPERPGVLECCLSRLPDTVVERYRPGEEVCGADVVELYGRPIELEVECHHLKGS